MQSFRSSSSQATGDGLDLSLTGSQLSVSRRPGSASPAKHITRSFSVATEVKAKRNALAHAGLDSSQAINNLRRSNSTTQVNQRISSSISDDQPGDFLALFDSSSDGRRKLASLSKTSPEKGTTWNILDDQPRAFPVPPRARSTSTLDGPVGMKRKEATVPLAPNFTANNRSNKGAMGNSVTTMLHNNYSINDKVLTPKSSNQKATSLNNLIKATTHEDESSNVKKSEKNFSSNNMSQKNSGESSTSGSGGLLRRKEVSEEEAERFIQQVNQAAITIQRWYRRQTQRQRAGAVALQQMLFSKKEEKHQQALEESRMLALHQEKEETRRKIREEKARQARRTAVQELQQRRAQKALESKRIAEEELQQLKESGRLGTKKPRASVGKNADLSGSFSKANNAGTRGQAAVHLKESFTPLGSASQGQSRPAEDKAQDLNMSELTAEDQEAVVKVRRAPSKTTLTDLLNTLKLLEEEPEVILEPKTFKRDKYAWIDEEVDSNSLTTDNLERFGKMTHAPGVCQDGALLSEAKLQSIMSFLDEMEKSEQERPRSAASITRREGLLSEEELAQLEQASAVATEVTSSMLRLRLEVQEKQRAINLLQTALEIKKLKELMSATEKIRREKWIDEKTKKIKEITVKGLEPEIQKLITKHKQEIKKLKLLHEAEMLQSDERAAQRYIRQTEELREHLEQEKEELSQRERELARQRYEKQLEQEEQSLQQQRRRLYSEVAEEKERLNQQAARQRSEVDDMKRQLEEKCSLNVMALKEDYQKSKEEQERRHQAEMKALKERLEIEKQAWQETYMKKEEAWLLSRERELKEEVRKGRDKEIELVIQRLEAEMSTSREECERAAENRIKRIREKYEAELQELERSEQKLQERCNELKGRLVEVEGEKIRLQGLVKQKEQEAEDICRVKDRLTEERNSLSEVVRQEFADRLVETEEENKRLKMELSELRARHRLELERINREKEEELEEVHMRVKTAIVKKEESVNSLRKQHEATLKRADHLEALLEQQRKQLLSK
uniref:Centrosomal protein of 131 kDa isoform X3 n=1 Tax=Geotrypetes seraphini TaxID=260995 RepID=A0A6P8SRX8_GEOSA|nr:centrosomal protein of 131 kDa isoform X3 [Geotrypetes seraphini]